METEPRIILMDTTLRDGEQTQGISFTPAEKTNVAKALLNKLRVDRIEIASARVSEGEMDGVMRTTSWAADKGFLEQIEVLGFVDHNRSIDWILEAGGRVMNLLTISEGGVHQNDSRFCFHKKFLLKLRLALRTSGVKNQGKN